MSDIVERLRGKNAVVPKDPCLCDEAADEIERLRARAAERLVHYCVCCPEQETPRDGCDCVCCTTARLEAEINGLRRAAIARQSDLAEAEVLIKWAKNLKPKSEARHDIYGGTYETLAGEQIIEFHNRADNWLARRGEA